MKLGEDYSTDDIVATVCLAGWTFVCYVEPHPLGPAFAPNGTDGIWFWMDPATGEIDIDDPCFLTLDELCVSLDDIEFDFDQV